MFAAEGATKFDGFAEHLFDSPGDDGDIRVELTCDEDGVDVVGVIGEARDALRQKKLISVFLSVSLAKLTYDLQAIHGVELIDWDGDTSNVDYQRLVRGITAEEFPLTARRAGAGYDAFIGCAVRLGFRRRFPRTGRKRQDQGNDANAD